MRLQPRLAVQVRVKNPGKDTFLKDALLGLTKNRKELPSKYFYDGVGSRLFEEICSLDEYYVTRTEIAIMEANIADIVRCIGRHAILIEYGCGDCRKTELLIRNMPDLAAYVPIDISGDQLGAVAHDLAARYTNLEILPVCADFTCSLEIPSCSKKDGRRVAYFPGSSIGNFHPEEAVDFLRQIALMCGPGGALLIGVDLKKDPNVLHRAYNDGRGVTAAFNLNVINRINRELEGDFRPGMFYHYAFYNPVEGRIEMHLVSADDQTVHLGGEFIFFDRGETIWTESSYKYATGEFEKLASSAGFKVEKVWTDDRQWFSVQYLTRT